MGDAAGLPPLPRIAAALAGVEGAFLSHGSALALHGLAPAPPGLVTATAPRQEAPRPLGPRAQVTLRFVVSRAEDFAGVETLVVPGAAGLRTSGPERAVADGLQRPELCGGLAAVAGALWRGRARLDLALLVALARAPRRRASARRLGFLLELLAIGGPDAAAPLRGGPAASWIPLDPVRPAAGQRCAAWRLCLNVAPRELAEAAGLARLPGLERLGLGAVAPPRRRGAELVALGDAAQVPALPAAPGSAEAPAASGPAQAPALADALPIEVTRPRRLAGLCRRYDLLRVVVLEGAFAELAGRAARDATGRPPPPDHRRDCGPAARRSAPADGRIPVLVEMHTDRLLGLAELGAIEREMSDLFGRPVAVRTIRDLLHRLARLSWHGGPVLYHRHDRGQ